MKTVFAVLAVALTAVSQEIPTFSFYDYFIGEWDVQRSTVALKTGELTHDDMMGHYSIQSATLGDEEASMVLVGRSFDNDKATGEAVNDMLIKLEFSDKSTGVFKTAPANDPVDEAEPLFNFEFSEQNNGAVVAHGEWHGARDSFYQFQITSKDRFTLTVYPMAHEEGKEASATMYLGKRTSQSTKELSFWQKNSTYILVGIFLLFRLGPKLFGGAPAAKQD